MKKVFVSKSGYNRSRLAAILKIVRKKDILSDKVIEQIIRSSITEFVIDFIYFSTNKKRDTLPPGEMILLI